MTREQRRAADLAAAKAERWPPVGEVAHEAHALPPPLDPWDAWIDTWDAWIEYRRTVLPRHDQEESAA